VAVPFGGWAGGHRAVTPWILATAVLVVALLLAEAGRSRIGRVIAKPLASAGFVGAALAAGALDGVYGRAVLIGLLLSWVGDVALLSRRRPGFATGLAAFLAAHLTYCAAFVVRGVAWSWALAALLLLALGGGMVAGWLLPRVDASLRTAVAAYLVAITAMVVLAFGTGAADRPPLILAGAFAFYLSDLAVARDRFVKAGLINRLWGLPLYYGAQLLLAASVR
jgi:uncharacterized membrane protein YhhN